MTVQENISLQPYNTFGINARARYFVEINNVDDLHVLIRSEVFQSHERLILGGGSNMLLVNDFDGLVIKNNITGVQPVKEDENTTLIEAGGGENWHELVLKTIAMGLGGIENLSLIPGTVGAAPIQNIGAYGVELKDTFVSLKAFDLREGTLRTFDKEACGFGYRDSYFKNEGKGRYFIFSVTLQLDKHPEFNTGYGAIQETLEKNGIEDLSVRAISDAVIEIRSSKLPDPAKIGNSGSFFKNPEISKKQFEDLKARHPDIVGYPVSEDTVKVPAGWLIDHAGWKGKRMGNCGVHDKQALVLVNYGGTTGKEIWELAGKVQDAVEEKYGIRLQPEVNVIGSLDEGH